MTALVVVAPTDAQLAYIAGLCEERGLEPPAAVDSKDDASECIAAILRRQYDPRDYTPSHLQTGSSFTPDEWDDDWVCLYCHAFIHAHPRLARERGWLAGSAS